jgi:putative ABC transport system ATP-binding protein
MAPAERRERAGELLGRVGLGGRAGHRPNQLSGGQQQRVAIARALANQPDLLLADEPTGALDQATGQEVLALFETLNRGGLTLIIVTHDGQVAARAKRRVAFLDGRIAEDERSVAA